MINQKHNQRIVEKVKNLSSAYRDFLVVEKKQIEAEFFETRGHYSTPPVDEKFMPIESGQKWGSDFTYAWFRLKLEEADLKGNKYLFCDTGATESLVFIGGKPCGMLDYVEGAEAPRFRTHVYLPLSDFCGEKELTVYIEGYYSHKIAGCMPYEKAYYYGLGKDREPGTFRGIYVVAIDEDVDAFLDNLYLLDKLYCSVKDEFIKGEIFNLYEEVLKCVQQMPCEYDYAGGVREANRLIGAFFSKETEKREYPYVGIIGHSHLDTAWLWPIDETKRKAARTVANAVSMMKKFPGYTFVFSSAVHLDWIKTHYPALFEEVKKYVKEGRFEPNGGAWVECDCNLVSGESLARQFLYGQSFLKENLGYTADTFWLPDTFGYSAALPQVLKLCGISYFCTTKMSWNDTTRFPYDSFIWRGIDGSEVIAHLNCLHVYADPETVIDKLDGIANKHLSQQLLLPYGFGDGGGGPGYKMIEYAQKTARMPYLPKVEQTTVSKFMQKLSQNKRLPRYFGELYLELHRGTLTSISEMKATNRKLEILLHDLDYLAAVKSKHKQADKKFIDETYKGLLVNQFHDILPGTSINQVNDRAIAENKEAISRCEKRIDAILSQDLREVEGITFVNTLNFDRKEIAALQGKVSLKGLPCQSYIDLEGRERTDVCLFAAGFSSQHFEYGQAKGGESPFRLEGNTLYTPYYIIELDDKLRIKSAYDIAARRSFTAGPINSYRLFDDVPYIYDNWDIDADYVLKDCGEVFCEGGSIVSQGPLELIIRNKYRISPASTLTVDTVFYSELKRIDFRCLLDWNDKHKLLKAFFPLNIASNVLKSEIQFGHIDRVMGENTSYELAKYEVSNFKWSDLSETNYGVTLINDCKYGISCKDSCLGLTLVKSGTHPDSRGDKGVKKFSYSLLPHTGPFNAGNSVLPAYSFNYPLRAVSGKADIAPLFKADAENIICETVKIAENGRDIILRLYECEKSRTRAEMEFPEGFDFFLCDILENDIEPIRPQGGRITLEFAPFEIKNIRLVKR